MGIPFLSRVLNLEIERSTDANSSEVVRGNDSRLTNARTPTAHGTHVPAGGASGQVLTKNSATDGDVGWTTPSGGGANITWTDGGGVSLSGSPSYQIPAMAVGEIKFFTIVLTKTGTTSGSLSVLAPAGGTYAFSITASGWSANSVAGKVAGGNAMASVTTSSATSQTYSGWVRRLT